MKTTTPTTLIDHWFRQRTLFSSMISICFYFPRIVCETIHLNANSIAISPWMTSGDRVRSCPEWAKEKVLVTGACWTSRRENHYWTDHQSSWDLFVVETCSKSWWSLGNFHKNICVTSCAALTLVGQIPDISSHLARDRLRLKETIWQ